MMTGGCFYTAPITKSGNIRYPTPLSEILCIGLPIRKGPFRGYGYGGV